MLLLLQSSIRITSNTAPLFQQQQHLEDDDDLLIFAWLLFMSRYYRQER